MKLISFFAGAGGFDLGFDYEGFEIAGVYEWDKYAIESYNNHFGTSHTVSDVKALQGEHLPEADVWTFGFPCQDISIAGQQAGIQGSRSGMFFEIMRLLGEVDEQPKIILAENVKNVKKYLPIIEEEYNRAGYSMYAGLYNSKNYGVPQNRERYFIIGVHHSIEKEFVHEHRHVPCPRLLDILEIDVDARYYMSHEKAQVVIEQYMEKLYVREATKLGYKEAAVGDSINISHPNSTTRRGRVGQQVAQTLLTGNEQIIVEGMLDMKGNEQIRRVYNTEGISQTLTTSEGGHRQPKVLVDEPLAIRKLTPREYARLQGFPDDYEQIVSNTQFYKQMGNAVSVPVAQHLAKQIKSFLQN